MLLQQNYLRGSKLTYPFPLLTSDANGRMLEITINDEDELWHLIDEAISEPSSEKKTIKQIMIEIGLRDTVNLLDIRTGQLLQYYDAFKNVPTVLNNEIWLWTLSQLNRMQQPRLF